MPEGFELAQLNVGRMLAPVDSPEIAGFVAQLEPINRLADASPGFIWRLQTDTGNATDIRPTEDDLFLINMSVWSSIEALRAFTYSTAHVEVLRQRREWFERLATAHLVLWWVPVGSPADGRGGPGPPGAICDGTVRPLPRSRSARRSSPMPSGPGVPLVDAEFCWPDLAAS